MLSKIISSTIFSHRELHAVPAVWAWRSWEAHVGVVHQIQELPHWLRLLLPGGQWVELTTPTNHVISLIQKTLLLFCISSSHVTGIMYRKYITTVILDHFCISTTTKITEQFFSWLEIFNFFHKLLPQSAKLISMVILVTITTVT